MTFEKSELGRVLIISGEMAVKFRTGGKEYEAEAGKKVLLHAGRQGCTDVPEDVRRTELSETKSFDVVEANLVYLK